LPDGAEWIKCQVFVVLSSVQVCFTCTNGQFGLDATGQGRVSGTLAQQATGDFPQRKVGMILQLKDVTMRFGGLVAVNRVSLGVEAGEIFGLIGPNGAGKTTLLNIIAGVYKPNAGAVKFGGQDITGLTPERICRKGIARTFQVSRRFAKMSARDNVVVAATFGNRGAVKNPRALAEEMLAFVQFPMSEETVTKNLSATQLKRLDLARALATDPELLLLDEPASGLTPSEVQDYMALFRKIRDKGITIIVVEHLMRMIMAICDRMLVLNYGKEIAVGTPDEIQKNQKVIDAYLGESDS
jgi:branched-chain amino acid transport system ATP-binding protein